MSRLYKKYKKVHHQHSDSEPEVDTIEIYVDKHYNVNRQFFIWIQFNHNMKLCEMTLSHTCLGIP